MFKCARNLSHLASRTLTLRPAIQIQPFSTISSAYCEITHMINRQISVPNSVAILNIREALLKSRSDSNTVM